MAFENWKSEVANQEYDGDMEGLEANIRLNHKLLWVILSIGAMWILTIYYIKQ